MTTTTKTAKKLYEVFANNDDNDVIQDYKTKLNICTDENRISVWMTVNRKTLKSAYSYFHKALEQAVADGALDAKIAQFGEFADDTDCIDFGGKDSITAFDYIDSSFAYGIDDNSDCDLGYYFWFWVKTNETAAEDNVEVIAETDTAQVKNNDTAHVEETATDINEAELIKHNGLSFEGFLATNAGLTIEEYRARKAEQQAAEQAEAERRTKIFNLKDGIASTEYKINETSGTLNDIIKNHYRPESDDGSWDEYTAELGDTLATAVSTLNTLKAQLAELEPAIVEDNTDNTTEDNVDDTDSNTATKTDEPKEFTAQVEDEPALVDCAYEFNLENGVREFKIGDAETGDVISFHGSRWFKITSTKHDARLYRDEDGTLHFDIKCYDGSPQLTMHDVTPDEFFAYVEVHDTTREEIARLPLVELKRKHARVFEESLRLGEYLFCSEDRTAYDKAHACLMQLICNGFADTAERWRLEEVNAPRRKRIVDAEIKYSCLQYKIGKYAEEIDAREKNAVRAHEPREDVPNVEDNILLDPAKIVSATPEASTKIKKLFSRRKNHERKKNARHIQHRPRRMVHAARRH